MLATKFKPDEPVVVKTPSSISSILAPENSITLTVDSKGTTFFAFDNKEAKKTLIERVNTEKGLNLTPEEKKAFSDGASIGVPLNQLKAYLALPSDQKGTYPSTGVPVDTSHLMTVNELAYWVQNARLEGANTKEGSPRICIKADGATAYPMVKNVIKTLTKNEIDRFNLITSLEAIPAGTEAYTLSMGGAPAATK
jgi:biopolymer transport protein ExbD